jgi:sec-independent protein translocase protein TatC
VLSFYPGPGALYDLLAAPLVSHLPAGRHADRHQRDLAVPRAAQDHADGGVPGRPCRWCLYQAWAFVAPGLYMHEKKLVLPLVVSSTLLFFLGIGFCYFFVFGKVFTFIQAFAPKSVSAMPDIEAYLSFVLTMFIAFGAAFEVPIVVVVLARIGMVSIES